MLFSNIPLSHEHIYAHTKSILLPLGEYFQFLDDFLDHSVTPEVLGKIGTDNTCPWVVNTALLLTSEGGGKKYTVDEKKVIEIAEEVTVMPYVHLHPTSLTSDTPFAKDRFSRSRRSYRISLLIQAVLMSLLTNRTNFQVPPVPLHRSLTP